MIASLIFFPSKDYSARPPDYGLTYEEVRIITSDETELNGWYLPAEKSEAVIYFLHGNAGNIGDRLFKVKEWVNRGYSVFLLDYRSYGSSKGTITGEENLYEDARAGLKWLHEERKKNNKDVILYGESVGSAPVLQLASENSKQDFLAVILEAPFTSLAEVTKVHYPFVPTAILGSFQFDNLAKISKVKVPILIIHGEQDEICPFKMGEALFEKALGQKEFYKIPDGHHNDLTDVAGSEFFDRALRFLNKFQ